MNNKTQGSVAGEIKQTKPFPSISDEAVISLLRTTDLTHRFLDRVVATQGITMQQYNVLRILRGAGSDGLPTLDIVDRMVEHAPGITRLIDRLVAKALVTRKRCERDRRIVYCRITTEGLNLLGSLDGPLMETVDAALVGLSEAQQRQLIALLDAMRAGLHSQLQNMVPAESVGPGV